MKEVVIKFEPFILNQTVFIKEDSGEIIRKDIPQRELANYISLLTDVDKVHLFGNKKFAEKIKSECITKYKIAETKFIINK